ncbi:ATP-binding protein [Micromonospora sp. WMMD882]|uniref:ATP-binding protein n=1 Tax=Micromonospora sp. WMMD882 TaxID=3015151 RepID=UPI00248B5536|nr:ATP-binding protein [Micromonospora sp. WMMD882]WBB78612.1 ATP-binding protein [Micromonospora sp. WMMD882]
MRRVHLEAAEDHVERLARLGDPIGALKELIWNALDADATKVIVELEKSDLGGIEKIVVSDDGDGISPESSAAAFDRIGGSWKKGTRRTRRLHRMLHGSAGQGRLRGYALGEHIRWTSVADGIDGRARTVIAASASARNDFEISDPVLTSEETGTVFEAWGKQSPKLDKLVGEAARNRITAELAPYLAVYKDVEVIYDGERIDPQTSILREDSFDLSFKGVDGEDLAAKLRVIEWSIKPPRELHLCDADGITVDVMSVGIQAPGFDFTAYVLWDQMREHQGEFLIAHAQDSNLGALIEAAKSRMREHFKHRLADRRREVVDEWKADGVYPYKGEPDSDTEQVERETFDLIATTVHRQIPKAGNAQRTTLALLKEAVRHQPDNVHRLLDELFRLTADDKAELDRLLNRTSLSSLIKASSDIADRLDFLAALKHMVFEPEIRRVLKERTQLHKILENEAWIFGEHYRLLVSDRSLDVVLDRHLKELGREERSPEPVRRDDGSVGIVDLMLSRARLEHDRRQHLVVELKAPSVKVGPKEISQIKSYAQAVANAGSRQSR